MSPGSTRYQNVWLENLFRKIIWIWLKADSAFFSSHKKYLVLKKDISRNVTNLHGRKCFLQKTIIIVSFKVHYLYFSQKHLSNFIFKISFHTQTIALMFHFPCCLCCERNNGTKKFAWFGSSHATVLINAIARGITEMLDRLWALFRFDLNDLL